MPSNSKNSKTQKQEAAPVAASQEVKQSKTVTAVLEAAVPAAPAVVAQKQTKGKKVESVAAVAEVAAPVVAAQVVAAPAVELAVPAQKAGSKKSKTQTVAAPAPVVAQKVVKTKAPKVTGAVAAVAAVVPAEVGKQVAGGKKAAPKASKAPKVAKAAGKETEVEAEVEGEEAAKGVRSFKVQLPGTSEYTGRFTGLTPYQAANKALSKFFRENKGSKGEITFSIRESTRGSKRNTYTYNGKREKLEVPVKYSIQDGREIVKEYKNKLTKIKKMEMEAAALVAGSA